MIPILLTGGPFDHACVYIEHKTWSLDIIERSGDYAVSSYRYDFLYVETNCGMAVFGFIP